MWINSINRGVWGKHLLCIEGEGGESYAHILLTSAKFFARF